MNLHESCAHGCLRQSDPCSGYRDPHAPNEPFCERTNEEVNAYADRLIRADIDALQTGSRMNPLGDAAPEGRAIHYKEPSFEWRKTK